MWFPELFNRFDEYARAHNGSEQALVCEVCVYLKVINNLFHI